MGAVARSTYTFEATGSPRWLVASHVTEYTIDDDASESNKVFTHSPALLKIATRTRPPSRNRQETVTGSFAPVVAFRSTRKNGEGSVAVGETVGDSVAVGEGGGVLVGAAVSVRVAVCVGVAE